MSGKFPRLYIVVQLGLSHSHTDNNSPFYTLQVVPLLDALMSGIGGRQMSTALDVNMLSITQN